MTIDSVCSCEIITGASAIGVAPVWDSYIRPHWYFLSVWSFFIPMKEVMFMWHKDDAGMDYIVVLSGYRLLNIQEELR